jgi:DNA uptake protein ComE-like DNA-binding protein
MAAIVPLLRWPAPAAALWLAFAAGAQAQEPAPAAAPGAAPAEASATEEPVPKSLPKRPRQRPAAGERTARKGPGKKPGKARVVGALNVNRATEAKLRLLPGIGKGRAHAIVERRPKGGYRSVDEVGRIKGLRKLVHKLRGHLTTEGPSTLRPAPPEAERGPGG